MKVVFFYLYMVLIIGLSGCRRCETCKRTITINTKGMPTKTLTETFHLCGKDLTDADNTKNFRGFPGGDSTIETKCKRNRD